MTTRKVRVANYRDQETAGKSGLAMMLFCGVVAVTRLMAEGGLPEPLPTLNAARPRWLVADIELWIAWGRPGTVEFARLKADHEAEAARANTEARDLVCA